MLFSGGFHEPWGDDEKRQSKLVFIGRNLNAEELAARFNACLATPENLAKKAESLRFKVGDRVQCMLDQWTTGTVVALWWRGESMDQGEVAPYQIRLDVDNPDGSPELIYALADDDRCIRALQREWCPQQ